MSNQEPRQVEAGRDRAVEPAPFSPETGVNPTMEQFEMPGPALGGKHQPVVQINVEEDQPIGGGTQPVSIQATDHYGQYTPRTIAMVAVAVIAAVILAFPVIFGFVELFALVGIIGPWIWAWVTLLVALVAVVVIIGYHIAQSGL